MKSKVEWRNWIKKQIKSVPPSKKIALESKVCAQVESFMTDECGLWSCYFPLPDEADISSVLLRCSHINWCFPRVENEREPLTFWKVEPQHLRRLIEDYKSNKEINDPFWIKSHFGLIQPQKDSLESPFTQVSSKELKGLLVPGLAFDQTGMRLGRGKGYFDRTLENTSGVLVGVSFSFQLIKEILPADPWDKKMDIVITDCEIRKMC